MKKIDRKGFTLIELLAVIIILGVLLLIAVPAVSKYTEQSKKDTYVTNVHNFVNAIKTEVAAGRVTVASGECGYVDFADIKLDKGSNTKSPYGPYEEAFVEIENENGVYTYKAAARDDQNRGFELSTIDDSFVRDSIVTITTELTPTDGCEELTISE